MPSYPNKNYSDPRWLRKRADVVERDQKCAICGRGWGIELVPQHKAIIRGREFWDYPTDLLVTVCAPCDKRSPEAQIFNTEEEALEYFKPKTEIPKQLELNLEEKKKGVTGYKYVSLTKKQISMLNDLCTTTGIQSTELLQIAAEILLGFKDFVAKFHDKEKLRKTLADQLFLTYSGAEYV